MKKKRIGILILALLVVFGLMFSLVNAEDKKDQDKKGEKKCIHEGIHIDLSGLAEGLKALEHLDLKLEGLDNLHLKMHGLKALKNLDIKLHGLHDHLKVLEHIDVGEIVHRSLSGLEALNHLDLGEIISESVSRGMESMHFLHDFDFDWDWDDDDFFIEKKSKVKKKSRVKNKKK